MAHHTVPAQNYGHAHASARDPRQRQRAPAIPGIQQRPCRRRSRGRPLARPACRRKMLASTDCGSVRPTQPHHPTERPGASPLGISSCSLCGAGALRSRRPVDHPMPNAAKADLAADDLEPVEALAGGPRGSVSAVRSPNVQRTTAASSSRDLRLATSRAQGRRFVESCIVEIAGISTVRREDGARRVRRATGRPSTRYVPRLMFSRAKTHPDYVADQ